MGESIRKIPRPQADGDAEAVDLAAPLRSPRLSHRAPRELPRFTSPGVHPAEPGTDHSVLVSLPYDLTTALMFVQLVDKASPKAVVTAASGDDERLATTILTTCGGRPSISSSALRVFSFPFRGATKQ